MPRRSPMGLKIGYHVALRDYPPKNVKLDTALTQSVFFSQKANRGAFAGLTFTTDFFNKILNPIFKSQ